MLRRGIFIVLSVLLVGVSTWWGYRYFSRTENKIANHDTIKAGNLDKVASLSPSIPAAPSGSKADNEDSEGTEQAGETYTRYVTVLNGKVAVYNGHPAKGGVIYMLRDIDISLLPEAEKADLRSGIWAKDDTDVLNLLEGWSGMIE